MTLMKWKKAWKKTKYWNLLSEKLKLRKDRKWQGDWTFNFRNSCLEKPKLYVFLTEFSQTFIGVEARSHHLGVSQGSKWLEAWYPQWHYWEVRGTFKRWDIVRSPWVNEGSTLELSEKVSYIKQACPVLSFSMPASVILSPFIIQDFIMGLSLCCWDF